MSGSAPLAAYDIVPAADCADAEIVEALAAAFDRDDLTAEWFRWKHRECPFGPSDGWVARDERGVVGVRLFTPWRGCTPEGEGVGLRPLDGGVVPRARRQGIFAALVRTEMERRRASGEPVIVLSTSVPASRAAYVKLGWSAVGDLPHVAAPVVPRPARLADWDPVPDERSRRSGIGTSWTADALRWRFRPESGYRYESVRLGLSDDAAGLVYRVVARRGLRTLVVEHTAGADAAVGRVIRAAAAKERAVVTLRAGHSGGRSSRSVGRSALTSWSVAVDAPTEPGRLDGWDLTFADVEGVL
ncbi:MAG: GNAT family N-acetyltransferase [Actinomycetota bacterium]